jgi:hypothetical protein
MYVWRNKGARHLLDLFNNLPVDMEVVAVKFPTARRYKDYTIVGNVPVIRVLETHYKTAPPKRVAQIVAIDPVTQTLPRNRQARRLDYMLVKYGLQLSVRRRITEVCKDIEVAVYLPRIPTTVSIEVDRAGLAEVLTWTEWVVEAIRLGHFYPRPGPHCNDCAFATVCSTQHVNHDGLRSCPKTARTVREALGHGTEATPTGAAGEHAAGGDSPDQSGQAPRLRP